NQRTDRYVSGIAPFLCCIAPFSLLHRPSIQRPSTHSPCLLCQLVSFTHSLQCHPLQRRSRQGQLPLHHTPRCQIRFSITMSSSCLFPISSDTRGLCWLLVPCIL